jgi:hypothetical protein
LGTRPQRRGNDRPPKNEGVARKLDIVAEIH